jgi:RHS repeat-associated protein
VSYDGAGSVKGFNDSVAGNWTVTNDNLHRMSKVTGALGGVAATATETYDHFGNRNVEYLTSNGNQQQPSPYLNFTSGNNRVSNWSYDNAGNLLSDGSNNYLYDAENRLCAVQPLPPLTGTFGYFYAANGPLLALGNLTSFTCDLTKNGILTGGGSLTNVYMAGPQGERLIETDGSFNLKHYNVFWEGKLLGTFTGASDVQTNWHFALNDWLGTKRVTTTSAGAPWTSVVTAPFGDFQSQSGPGTDPSEEHFTSKPRDPNSNLDYFGARYYNSNLGRFMSPDSGDGGDSDPSNPQSWNLYSYVQNNPLTNTDPDGHDCVTQTRTSDTTEFVSVSGGTCSGSVGDGQSQTYVPGTVTGISVNGGNSLDIGYNSYDGSSSGVTNASSAPIPDNPGLAYGYGNNAAGYNLLGTTGATVGSVKGVAAFYGASALGGAAVYGAGLALGALGPGAFSVPGILTLPAVPSAIEKLQNLGISVQEASQIVGSPASQRLVDNLNNGNINWVQNIDGKLIRITTDPNAQRIISAGIMRANQVTNGIASGRFTTN